MTFDPHTGLGFGLAGDTIHDDAKVRVQWGKVWEAGEDTPEEDVVGTAMHGSCKGQAVQIRRKD